MEQVEEVVCSSKEEREDQEGGRGKEAAEEGAMCAEEGT